jgi:lambda family phage holin
VQDSLQEICLKVLEYWFLIAMVATAGLMSVFRTAKNHGKVDWLESAMCALFAYGIWFALSWFNIPEGVGVLIGGFIGYKGTHVISKWVSDKLGMSKE